jgi:hypothetical protein
MFPSRYLKAADIGGKDVVLTIVDVTIEDLGTNDRKENKPVMHFKEISKVWVLNKTNALSVSHLYGDQAAGWFGKRITLYVIDVPFQGTMWPAIRVRMRPPMQQTPLEQDLPDLPEEPPDLWG